MRFDLHPSVESRFSSSGYSVRDSVQFGSCENGMNRIYSFVLDLDYRTTSELHKPIATAAYTTADMAL